MGIDVEGRAAVAALEAANELTVKMLRHPAFLIADAAQRLRSEGVTREQWESLAALAWQTTEEQGHE